MKFLFGIAALLLATPALGSDPPKYMGSRADQAVFENNRLRCWKRAYPYLEKNPSRYSRLYASCIDRAFEGRGGTWAVLAYGFIRSRDYYTLVWNSKSLLQATRRAVQSCQKSGRVRCVLRYFTRNGCIALARGAYGTGDAEHGFGSARTVRDTRRIALRNCAIRSCKIVWLKCPGK